MDLNQGDVFFFTLMGTVLFVLMVGFFFAFVLMYRRRQIEFENERLIMEQEFSEELLRTQLELSEQVMRNISEEIHDNIGQTLTVAKLNLNAMTDSNYAEHSANAKDLITRSLQDLRNLSKTLNGDFILREGVQNAISREVDVINSSGDLNCTFDGDIPGGWLTPNSEIILFRCVQEALSNALKHANAKRITVVAAMIKDTLNLEVKDDGTGFEQSEKTAKGMGMGSMAKRIGMLGGEFDIESGIGRGTKVLIKLPKYKLVN